MVDRIWDVGIVGGGLGGLTTAALLAGRGLDVIVLERASAPGGRASTHTRNAFFFNQGAHALYRGGAAARVLGRLGVAWHGRRPAAAGLAIERGRVHKLPTTAGALLTTTIVGWSGKVQGARVMARLGAFDARALDDVPLYEWAQKEIPDDGMRSALEAFVRVSTYAHAPARLSTGAALDQLRLAQGPGVDYVDEGWGSLVSAVARVAEARGVTVEAGTRVACASHDGSAWTVSAETSRVRCACLVLATGPAAARSIVASEAIASWASSATPVHAACLDVGLSRLPCPRTLFALGVDAPLYFSVHSATARVAPAGCALVSTMKYLAPDEHADAGRDRPELEGLLDLLQPGWRDVLVDEQWLPGMVASNALPEARVGGARGRPGPRVPDVPSAWVVGDWTGQEGMLLDASLASAERTADELAAMLALSKAS